MGSLVTTSRSEFCSRLVLPKLPPFVSYFSDRSVADFAIEHKIGAGSSSQVFRVRERCSGRLFALKRLKRKGGKLGRLDNYAWAEAQIFRCVRSPFLLPLHAFFCDEEAYYFLLPYAPFGDLRSQLTALKRLPEAAVTVIAAEILTGLEVLHAHGIAHCDLKPENVLIGDGGRVMIADFGFCQRAAAPANAQGTPAYMSPETVLNRQQTDAFARDLWAFGVMLYELIDGATPFEAGNRYDMYKNIIRAEPRQSAFLGAQSGALVSRLLASDPRRRPSLRDIKRDAFFAGVSWGDLRKTRSCDLLKVFVRALPLA